MRLPGAFDAACLMSLFLLVSRAAAEAGSAAPRYLVYPPPADGAPTKVQLIFGLGIPMEVDVSTIVGYVMKCNYNLPYNASYLAEPYVREQRSTAGDAVIDETSSRAEARKSRAKAGSENDVDGGGSPATGRYEIYKMLESAIDSGFRSGKACLLRAICEAAATPLNTNDGLFAQLLHIFLTPSSSGDGYLEPTDQEYLAAESVGRSSADCGRTFSECQSNFLDYLSNIH